MVNSQIEDIQFLQHNFDALITKYQAKIKLIIKIQIQKGLFNSSDEADVIQNVNEQLLKRKEKIQRQYTQKASVSGYFNAIINNICIDLYRKQKSKITTIPYSQEVISSPLFSVLIEKENNIFNQLIIKEELEKLGIILRTYTKNKKKLDLCLKLISGTVISPLDILCYNSNCSEAEIDLFIAHLKENSHRLTDKVIYTKLNALFNKIESKQVTIDAVKKWTEYKVKQIIYLLNKSSDYTSYDKSSLRILLKMYYDRHRYRQTESSWAEKIIT